MKYEKELVVMIHSKFLYFLIRNSLFNIRHLLLVIYCLASGSDYLSRTGTSPDAPDSIASLVACHHSLW